MASDELWQALVPRLATKENEGVAIAVARTCRTLRAAVEARLSQLHVSCAKPTRAGMRRSPMCLRDIGTRFARVNTLHVYLQPGAAAELSKTLQTAGAAWPSVLSLFVEAESWTGPEDLVHTLALLTARCLKLGSVQLIGDARVAPSGAGGPGATGLFAALSPTAGTLRSVHLQSCTGLVARDVSHHLPQLSGLTCLAFRYGPVDEPGAREAWDAMAAAVGALTALEVLTVAGRDLEPPGARPLRLAPLARLRVLEAMPAVAEGALRSVCAEGGALAALTKLRLRGPCLTSREEVQDDVTDDDLLAPEPLGAAAIAAIAGAAPALAVLYAHSGILLPHGSPAALPASLKEMRLGPSDVVLARLAPQLTSLSVLEALQWGVRLEAALQENDTLERVTFTKRRAPSALIEDEDEEEEDELNGGDGLCFLAELPRLRAVKISQFEHDLLAGPRAGEWVSRRLCAWALAWAGGAVEELDLYLGHAGEPLAVLALIGAAMGARLRRLSLMLNNYAHSGDGWGRDAPGFAARGLLSLPLFTRLEELSLDLVTLGPLPLPLPSPASTGARGGEVGESSGQRGSAGGGWEAPIAALLAPLSSLRPASLARVDIILQAPKARQGGPEGKAILEAARAALAAPHREYLTLTLVQLPNW